MRTLDPAAGLGYTPEYSDELLSVIIDIYKDEIKPYLNDLKLHKMIDLIETTQSMFEHYHQNLMAEEHKRCLRFYIVGLFYIYLIIPNSIQFQIKNKNYEFFLSLKQLYEKELNMVNVKLQTVNYIRYLTEKFTNSHIELLRTKSKRSNTLPSSAFPLDINTQIKKDQELASEFQQHTYEEHNGDLISPPSSRSSSSTNSSIVEEELWSPPDLQPNDQLKLATDNYSTESLGKIPDLPSHAPPPPPEDDVPAPSQFNIKHANTLPLNFQPVQAYGEPSNSDDSDDHLAKEYLKQKQARKHSHQSVYANEEDDDLNELPSICAKDLFDELSTNSTFYLIFDLRNPHNYEVNHIDYEHTLNIDPSNLIDVHDYQDLSDLLKTVLHSGDYKKFKNLKTYEKVVIYTDNKNFLSSKFDYVTNFRSLIYFEIKKIEILQGGFDSWLKFLTRNHQSSKALKFKAKPSPIASLPPSQAPPSIPPPSPPKKSYTETPYDYSKFLPQYSAPSAPPPSIPQPNFHPNNTSSKVMNRQQQNEYYSNHHQPQQHFQQPPIPPAHQQPIQYQRPQQPVPYSIPENQAQNYPHQAYSQQQYPNQQGYGPPYQQPSQSFAPPPVSSNHHSSRTRANSIPTLQKSSNPYVRLSITGLRNLSNTCYINSMLQCLFASTQFREIFLNNKYDSYINPQFSKLKISPALATLFKKMFLNGGCSIVPSGFLKSCNQLRPDLKIPSEQQDTQEFLMFLLDQLHDELSNSNTVVNDYPQLMSYDSSLGEEYSKWFEGLIKQGFSPISEIFQGQLKDSLKCMKCGFESSNFSTFYMLSLVIPKVNTLGKKLKKIQLEDCIKMFTNEEILTGENAWDCPKCSKASKAKKMSSHNSSTLSLPDTASGANEPRKHRLHFGNGFKFRNRSSSPSSNKKPSSMSSSKSSSKTIKSLNFVRLPPILIIHLSRFLFYDLSTKDTSIVQYPLILEFDNEGQIIKYRLFGVVNHNGTLKSGHYTSITNKSLGHDLADPNWYYFDDENVKATTHGDIRGTSHLASSEVYVLFYERIF